MATTNPKPEYTNLPTPPVCVADFCLIPVSIDFLLYPAIIGDVCARESVHHSWMLRNLMYVGYLVLH